MTVLVTVFVRVLGAGISVFVTVTVTGGGGGGPEARAWGAAEEGLASTASTNANAAQERIPASPSHNWRRRASNKCIQDPFGASTVPGQWDR